MDHISESTPNDGALSVRFSLRNKLLLLLLGLTFFVFVSVAYLSITTIQNIGETAQQASGDALSKQAEAYLSELVISNARENDLALERVRNDAQNVAQYAAFVLGNPEVFAADEYWSADDYMFVGTRRSIY